MTPIELQAKAQRIENSVKATAAAYTAMGAALLELGSAMTDFFEAMAKFQEKGNVTMEIRETTKDWKM